MSTTPRRPCSVQDLGGTGLRVGSLQEVGTALEPVGVIAAQTPRTKQREQTGAGREERALRAWRHQRATSGPPAGCEHLSLQ